MAAPIDLIAINHGDGFDLAPGWRLYDLSDPTGYDYNAHPDDLMWRARGFRPTDEFVLAPGGLVAQVYESNRGKNDAEQGRSRLSRDKRDLRAPE